MRKYHGTEISIIAMTLVEECAAGVQFNWSQFLCEEFLENFHKVQEESKTFHYAWLLLSIVLVAIELPKESQFLVLDLEWLEAAWYASLWTIRDVRQMRVCR